MNASDDQVKNLTQRLYEDEGLTDALTDDDAKILLDWGQSRLQEMANLTDDQTELESTTRQLRRIMKTINRLVGQKADLDDTKMIQRLLRLVGQSMQLAQKQAIADSDD